MSFTVNERPHITTIIAANLAVANALRALAQSGEMKPVIIKETVRAARSVVLIPSYILGGFEDRTRAQVLQDAWSEMHRAINDTLPSAMKLVPGLALVRLAEARDRLESVYHLGPSYFLHSDPAVSVAPVSGRRTVISEHGDFNKFQLQMFWAQHYWHGWMEICAELLARNRTATQVPHFANSFDLAAYCITYYINASALVSNISFYWAYDNLDAFGKALTALKLLTADKGEGVAEIFRAWVQEWCKALGLSELISRSFLLEHDSWYNSARGEWEGLMDFPNKPLPGR